MHIEPLAQEFLRDSLRHTFVVDASHKEQLAVTGIGIVHHATNFPGRAGPVVGTYSDSYLHIPNSVAEEFALLRALEIAAVCGATHVKIRSDYNQLRRNIKHEHALTTPSAGSDLRSRILRLASTFAEVKFSYVPKRKNGWAHRLARMATESESPQVRSDIAWHVSAGKARPLAPQDGESPNRSLQRTR